MRGRADEIADPSQYGWEVVWEALKTEPPDDDAEVLTQELGLDQEQQISQGSEIPATEFSGTRGGRAVSLRLGFVPSAWRGKAVNEVRVAGSVPSFQVREDGGRLAAEAGAPPEVGEFLDGLAPAPDVWRDLEVEGGSDGILARRPVKAHSQGYVYDLWLVERLADRLGA